MAFAEESKPAETGHLKSPALHVASSVDLAAQRRPVASRPWLVALVLMITPALGFFVLVSYPAGWADLGIFHLRPYFVDTTAILAAGEAARAGLDVYKANPLDPLGRPHVYGPWWLITGQLGLKAQDAIWVGPLIDIAFLAVITLLLIRARPPEICVALGFLISPPVMFALERANNDLVVFILFAGAASLLGRTRWRQWAAGAVILVLAAALKMYPVAAFGALVGRVKEKGGLQILAGAVLLSAVICWHDWEAFRRALIDAPHPISIFVFGVVTDVVTWNSLAETRPWLVGGAVVALGGIGPLFIRRAGDLFRSVRSVDHSALLFVMTALAWIACMCCATNYGYRLLLVLGPVMLWLRQRNDPRQWPLARLQLFGWAMVFWLMLPKRWLAIGALHGGTEALRVLSAVVGFEQTLVLILTLAFGVALLGWCRHCCRGIAAKPPVV